jgi:hypothetical protein
LLKAPGVDSVAEKDPQYSSNDLPISAGVGYVKEHSLKIRLLCDAIY